MQELLQKGMSEVLETASGTEYSEPWPRVHAFNVLRLAFNDKTLAVDSSAFFATGEIRLIMAHYSSPHHDPIMLAEQLASIHIPVISGLFRGSVSVQG